MSHADSIRRILAGGDDGDPANDPPEVRAHYVHAGNEPAADNPDSDRPPTAATPDQYERSHFRGLATTRLADLSPRPLSWLVPDYIPLGKLVLIAGDGGHGKTTVTLDLAASLSTGRPAFGLNYSPTLPPSDVLIASCEDDFADTIVPRLLTMNADLSRLHSLDGLKSRDGKPLPFSLANYQDLEEHLETHPDVRLVVIDPAGAYVDAADDHRDSELRSLLGPLSRLAGERSVTVLHVKHLNKGTTAKAVQRIGGSAGYVNAVRASFVVVADQGDANRKLFLPLKFNIARKP